MQYPPPSILEKTEENSGFTLIELSIVLVIVALLIGGVLVGKDLIESAAVRAQISQIEQLQIAVNAFKGKYNCLPGDCRDAAKYGFSARTNADGDGDGDGMIEEYSAGGCANQFAFAGEDILFGRDLSNAKLISENLNGVADTATTPMPMTRVITYFPRSKIHPGAVVVPKCNWVQGNTNRFIIVGAEANFGNALPINYISTLQAYNIDSKVDDGLPQFGNLLAYNGWMWASGPTVFIGGVGSFSMTGGASTAVTMAPVTSATSPAVSTPASADTCYDNGNVANATEQYTTSINSGKGVNCSLSFLMQ